MVHRPFRRLNVLVLHPDAIVRTGLVAALRRHPRFDVFVDDPDCLLPEGTAIDVVITDYANAMRLAHGDGANFHGPLAQARVLALTANEREADIRRAIQAGIHGYLLLGISLDELIESVTAVGNGVRYLCVTVARRMADSLAAVTLTVRENEVLTLVASGQSNKGIARQLAIEVGTVKSHVSSIMGKLGAVSRTQAANIAVTRGLVDECASTQPVAFAPRSRWVEARP